MSDTYTIMTILTIFRYTRVSKEGSMAKRKQIAKYKTKDICDRFDISRATLFRWESEGMLEGVERDWRGWRLYTEDNVKTIDKIIRGKSTL